MQATSRLGISTYERAATRSGGLRKVLSAAQGLRFGPVEHPPDGLHPRARPDPFSSLRTAPCDRGVTRTMRNPRALTVTQQLAVQERSAQKVPGKESLFWRLWRENEDLARAALETGFVQGIARGSLDPVTFGRYNVSDAYYCFHAADDYAVAAGRAKDMVLKRYLHAKHVSYRMYNEAFPKLWGIRDANGIVPSEVCLRYSEFERRVVKQERPVYVLVAMLPCEHLWPWIGNAIEVGAEGNLYKAWIEENRDFRGAYAIGNVLADFEERHPGGIDLVKARSIYRDAMRFEWQNFATA